MQRTLMAPILTVLLLAAPAALSAADRRPDAAALLAATAGRWTGELQYRDYQSNTWQGLPMKVTIAAQPDGVTTVRTAQYDDGPQTGIVTITTVTLVDAAKATASYAIFRKNRATDGGVSQVALAGPAADMTHWTIVATETRKDGDDVAEVRETTTRNGDEMTTLKEVRPVGDTKAEWRPRNRTILHRVRALAASRNK